MELAASAQLRHQLNVLGSALQTAQLDPSQFGLTPNVRLDLSDLDIVLTCMWDFC